MLVFAGGVLLACGLVCGILYGTCKRDGSQHDQVENLAKDFAAAKARKEKEKATSEEKLSLAHAREEDEECAKGASLSCQHATTPVKCLRTSSTTIVDLD